ncbi:MAG: 30S ribosomal protein S8 [Planctomycetota bacterium]|nr:MAG: 30S ribosomal protein S8 [Planctomycetota bacterium]
MTMTDPIGDLLTRIRNGLQVRRKSVDMPSSRLKSSLALVLKEEGYIKDVEALADERGFALLRVHLKYDEDGAPAISEIQRVSKPGCRIYSGAKKIPVVRRGLGTTILSTPKGVLSGRKAAELGVGGEILCTLF